MAKPNKYEKKNLIFSKIFNHIITIILLILLFMIGFKNEYIFLFILLTWFNYRIDKKYLTIIGIIALLIAPLLIQINREDLAERATIYAFLFLISALLAIISESKIFIPIYKNMDIINQYLNIEIIDFYHRLGIKNIPIIKSSLRPIRFFPKNIINAFDQTPKQSWPILYYLLLTILIFGYSLRYGGYIFALDMIYGPIIKIIGISTEGYHLLPYEYFLKGLNLILPSYIIQRLVILIIIFITGFAMHKVIPIKSSLAKYFAGTLYIFNPFFYERLWAGQIGVCLAYAFFPFALGCLLKFLKEPDWKQALKLSIWVTVLIIFALHSIYIFGLLSLILIIVFIINKWRDKVLIKKFTGYILLAGVFCLMLNLFWLMPVLRQPASIKTFGTTDLEVFAPARDEQFGLFFNLTSLYGFWGEEVIVLPKEDFSYWPIFTIIFLGLMIFGYYELYKQKGNRWLANSMIIVFILSIILAAGAASPKTAWLNLWLFEHLPFYEGMRDSQKFIALTALVYAFLGAFGVQALWGMIKKLKIRELNLKLTGYIFAGAILLLPIVSTHTLLNGLDNHFEVSDYPQDWYDANNSLNKDKDNFRVLFLPWHGYMEFSFAIPSTIANPAVLFFDKPIIQADNIERGDLYTHSTRPESQAIEELLANKDNIGVRLKKLNIKYVILAHEVDFENYDFLDKSKDLSIFKQGDDLTVYVNRLY